MGLTIIHNADAAAKHGPGDAVEGFEEPDRLSQVLDAFTRQGLPHGFRLWQAPSAPLDTLGMVVSSDHLARISLAGAHGGGTHHGALVGQETYAYPGTLDAIRTAAGAVLRAVDVCIDGLVAGRSESVFVAARPPGHHAEGHSAPFEQAMGFCFVPHAALGALYCTREYGLRVAVLDLDAHEGNGTAWSLRGASSIRMADIFVRGAPFEYPYSDHPRVPSTENIRKISLPADTRPAEYLDILARDVLPWLSQTAPQLLICSMGYDCMTGDPVGGMRLGDGDVNTAARLVQTLQLPSIFVLEGGYHTGNLRKGVIASATALHV